MRVVLASVLLGAAITVTSPHQAASAVCTSEIGGGISNDGSYGGGGRAESCPPGSAAERVRYAVVREIRSEPIICIGTPDGLMETIRFYDRVTGTLIRTVSRCVGASVPGEPSAPPPPAPTDVLRRLPLPMPEIHTSPPGQGLVGFETHFWWGADTAVPPVTVTVGDWTATVAPRLERVEWDFGNGDTASSNVAGTEQDPSVVYTYEQQCECTVTVTATWGGQITLAHPLLGTPVAQTATGVPFTATLAYDVQEREAIIVG